MLRRTDRAYLAGLVDGEGSIGIDNHGGLRSPSVRITITNTNFLILEGLQELWGGHLAARRQRKSSWKPVSDLIWAARPETDRILKAIKPYLKGKREQCRTALLFNKTVNKKYAGVGNGVPLPIQVQRQELRKQMLELNKRGQPLTG